jgi:hypothetical protein
MSTRSDIIVQRADGQFVRVYCHWDGYLEHNGKILQENYNSEKLAEKLVKNGNISSLEAKCSKPKGHSFDKKVEGYTVYYGRDRGEPNQDGEVHDSLQKAWPPEDAWTEFTYVFFDAVNGKGKQWYVADPDEGTQTLILLADALAGKQKITPKIKMFGGIVIGRHSPLDEPIT